MAHDHAPGTRTAVITGGAGGLGRSIASALARAGHNIAIVDLDPEQGTAAEADISREAPCYFIPFDVTRYDDCPTVFDQVVERFGRVDVLVNAAGISTHRGPTGTIKVSDWDTITNVNLKGLFFMAKAVAPYMTANGGGSIINVASIRARLATGDRTIYAVTKKGVHSITAELAADYWRYGIRVNSISPGYVLTEMTRHHLDEPGWLDNQLDIVLTEKMVEPEDIGEVVCFLASEDSVAITGSDIPCDGGASICRGKPARSGL